jgi:hypothetical protein
MSKSLTLADEYWRRCFEPSDIVDHLPRLKSYAEKALHVTEFGVYKGNSTVAFFHGGPDWLVSYDLHSWIDEKQFRAWAQEAKTTWDFRIENVLDIPPITPTDLLFIDTWHHGIQLAAELELHAHRVRKWIILHDTETNGFVGSTGLPGMWPIIQKFCERGEWKIEAHFPDCNGLTVLKRLRPPSDCRADQVIIQQARALSREQFDENGVWRDGIRSGERPRDAARSSNGGEGVHLGRRAWRPSPSSSRGLAVAAFAKPSGRDPAVDPKGFCNRLRRRGGARRIWGNNR